MQGVIGGAHVGYNLQINQWVVGLEGDVNGTSLSKTQLVGAFPPFFQGLVNPKATVQGSIRARLGIAFDRVLIYATGGAAFADFTIAYNTLPLGGLDQITSTRSGWTAGGGLDYTITNNWSIGAEYRYSDFGSRNDFSAIALFPNSFVRHHLTEHQVQARFSYSSTAWRQCRSSRNIELLGTASTQTKPGPRSRVFIAASVCGAAFVAFPPQSPE